MEKIREATALLSGEALKENFTRLANAAGVDVGSAYALVKANAYGHGAVEVVKRLYAIGARRFAVARLSEGEEIRPFADAMEDVPTEFEHRPVPTSSRRFSRGTSRRR